LYEVVIQNTEVILPLIFLGLFPVSKQSPNVVETVSRFIWWAFVASKTVIINISEKTYFETFSKLCVFKLTLLSVSMKINFIYTLVYHQQIALNSKLEKFVGADPADVYKLHTSCTWLLAHSMQHSTS
jgi:hypothetical protein